jgi:hypothetical protein
MCDFRGPPSFVKIKSDYNDTIRKIEYRGAIPYYKLLSINALSQKPIEVSRSDRQILFGESGFVQDDIKELKPGAYIVTEITGSGYVYFDGKKFHDARSFDRDEYYLLWEECEHS